MADKHDDFIKRAAAIGSVAITTQAKPSMTSTTGKTTLPTFEETTSTAVTEVGNDDDNDNDEHEGDDLFTNLTADDDDSRQSEHAAPAVAPRVSVGRRADAVVVAVDPIVPVKAVNKGRGGRAASTVAATGPVGASKKATAKQPRSALGNATNRAPVGGRGASGVLDIPIVTTSSRRASVIGTGRVTRSMTAGLKL